MSTYTIRLEDGEEITDVTDFATVDGWWIDDNVITIVSHNGDIKQRYKLPRGKPRVTMTRLGNGRFTLVLGGFTTITVTVVGPRHTIEALREAVL